MRLPGGTDATVEERKIRNYLMNPTHPDGAAKARFFARAGYQGDAWRTLAEDLRRHALQNDVADTQESPYGTKYMVEGPLIAISGATIQLTTVWIVEKENVVPRLVTAYPT